VRIFNKTVQSAVSVNTFFRKFKKWTYGYWRKGM